ncbi:NACHT domain-containing protein [Streptomyces sp. NPDC051643]|uniref:NACHT domain-containing protein n=1 Tax=Streptomyces sp. NPDC051643 TaxID=3365665 RepID=UPI0037B66CDC
MLSLGGLSAALVLAWRFDLGAAQTAATALSALAQAYLAWAAFHADRVEAEPADADKVLEQLAVAIRAQWDNEAEVRRVNDPYPLPVAWAAGDGDLAEDWSLLTGLARSWPGGPPSDPALWPTDAAGLAGQDAEIGLVFSERMPTRRLVILGEPGAGKSVLMIRLLQDLIERRANGEPVPVLFSLASWDPHQPLKSWMADQLRRTHPGLATAAPLAVNLADTTEAGSSDLALHLLNAGRVLPMFDGFDELPPSQHATALDMLNRALPARQPLVLTSRTAPYRTALTRPGTNVRLNGSAVIQLLPLKAEQAANYLRRDAGGPHAPAARRWNRVITHLGTSSPVGQALATPLGLFLVRTIYNPRPDSPPGPLPASHPDELCDTANYPDRTAISIHLFHAFIPAAYAPQQPYPPRWSADHARRAFVCLARFLQDRRAGNPDLAWWELRIATPQLVPYLVAACVIESTVVTTPGFALGIGGRALLGLQVGIVFGLMTGLAAGFTRRVVRRFTHRYRESGLPSIRLRLSPIGIRRGFPLGIATGVTVGVSTHPVSGLLVGFTCGIVTSLMSTFRADAPDLTASFVPAALLALDRRTFLMFGLTLGLAFGFVFGTVGGVAEFTIDGIPIELATAITAGIGFGLAFGLTTGWLETAWVHFVIARVYLALRHGVPWRLMEFLQDAHEHRGVLRQAGAVYQFRHIDLQRHLAEDRPRRRSS